MARSIICRIANFLLELLLLSHCGRSVSYDFLKYLAASDRPPLYWIEVLNEDNKRDGVLGHVSRGINLLRLFRFSFGCVRVFLLLLQIVLHVGVWRRCGSFASGRFSVRSCR
jgi:hypothetical protein